jgi:hypothetical protein
MALAFLMLGTYAVPGLRVGTELALPYAVLLLAATAPLVLADRVLGGEADGNAIPAWLVWAWLGFAYSLALSFGTATKVDPGRILKAAAMMGGPVLLVWAAPEARYIKASVVLLGATSLAVFAYGVYGFVTGTTGDPIQHTFGYLGVTYEEATRNGDVMYFQTAFWILAAKFLWGSRAPASWLWGALAGVVAIGIGLTLSRGAWISTSLALIVVVWASGLLKTRRVALPMAAGLTAALFLAATGIWDPFGAALEGRVGRSEGPVAEAVQRLRSRMATIGTMSEAGGNSNKQRMQLITRAADLAWAHPLGIGIGNTRLYIHDIGLESGLNHVENDYAQLLLEQSAIGAASMLTMLLGFLALGYRRLRGSQRSDGWVGWALWGLMLDWLVYGMFNIMHESTWFWMILGLALTWAVTDRAPRARVAPLDPTPMEVAGRAWAPGE